MILDEQVVAKLADINDKLERLQARESRRLITDYDWLRGWKDDFLGKVLADQYTAVSDGAGSSGDLQNNAHGGIYRLRAGAGVGRSHELWLGDAADGFATLDAECGWVMIVRMELSHTTNIAATSGALDVAAHNRILAGMNTNILANNWLLQTRTGGGAINAVDTGVAADTSAHCHALNVYPITGARQVDYFLDGALIASTVVSVPTAVITGRVGCTAFAAAARSNDLDYWDVIPRNL